MTDEPTQDPVVADAIDSIPVPDYESGFWDRLDARLAEEGPVEPVDLDRGAEPVEPSTVVPLARRARPVGVSRRALVAIGAAAAVVLAVLAVSVASDGPDDIQTADGPRPTVPEDDQSRSPDVVGLGSAQAAFVAYAEAIDAGDLATAVSLVGPRSVAYYRALGTDVGAFTSELGEVWGVWANPDGRQISVLDLGRSMGDRVVLLVLSRPATDPADGSAYGAIPVVEADDGWRVEPDAFDPERDGRIEILSPAVGDGLEPIGPSDPIRVVAQPSGEVVFSIDGSVPIRLPASGAVDGVLTWRPGRELAAGDHVLVIAVVTDTTITSFVGPFEVRP